MWMLHVIVLVCAASVDQEHCNRDTATDVLMRERTRSPQQCAFLGQAGIAPTALAPRDARSYVKVLCVREHD